MYAAKAPLHTTTAARSFTRSRGGFILLTATATAAAVMGFRYNANAMHRNELAQRAHKAPNGYVAVDRSGGGI